MPSMRARSPPLFTFADSELVNGTRNLSYKEQRELEALPAKIEALEAEQAQLHRMMAGAEFYRQPSDKIAATMERLQALTNELEACYARWESLELRANAATREG